MLRNGMKIHTFKVIGSGAFPLDMLRYDQCWPAGSEDAYAIEESLSRHGEERHTRRTITLNGCGIEPTTGRWSSFLWHVVK